MKAHYITWIVLALLIGCRPVKEISTSEVMQNTDRVDSISLIESSVIKPLKIPMSQIKLTITPSRFDSLPPGAVFSDRSGQASVEIRKDADGNLNITASCDSLLLLVEEKNKEIYRLSATNKELSEKLQEQKEVKIREPTGWQWFWIYVGRLSFLAVMVWMGFKWFRNKWRR